MQIETELCIKILQSHGVILYPTDTVWGLGCDATDTHAVKRISELKKREENKPYIVLLPDENRIFDYVKRVPDIAFDLIDNAEKPLTIVYPGAKNLAGEVVHDDGSVAIRICKHPACFDLLEAFKKPLLSTSANFSGQKPALRLKEIPLDLIGKVDFIFNSEYECTRSEPSQIIKLYDNGTFKIIRS